MSSFDNRVDLRPAPQDRKLKPEQQKIMAAAREFESVMIHQMLSTMRETVHPDGVDGGSTMETYRDMMDQELSRNMARAGGLGLADSIARQLMGLDHGPQHPESSKG